MLTTPRAIKTIAPDDNVQYWTALISTYKRANKNYYADKCLYPMNISFEKVLWNIKQAYPPEIARWLAWRELELREDIKIKKGANYTNKVPDFDNIKVEFGTSLAHMNKESIIEIIYRRANKRFGGFQSLDLDISRHEVVSEVFVLAVKCANHFKDNGKACFETYLDKAITNHIASLWRKRKSEAERFISYNEEIGYNLSFPVKVDGKFVMGNAAPVAL